MAYTPSSYELQVIFALYVVILIMQLLFSLYLGRIVIRKKKDVGYIEFDFIFSYFLSMICLCISRVLAIYFDIFLTRLDPDTFYLMPNVIIWKTSITITLFGILFMLITTERKVLNFRLKAVPSSIILILILIYSLYPINSAEDFEFASRIAFLASGGLFIILIIFFYLGIRIPGLRRTTFSFAFGVIIYVIGQFIASPLFITPLSEIYGVRVFIMSYFLYTIIQIIGLLLMTLGASGFVYTETETKDKPIKELSSDSKVNLEESKISLVETLSASRPAEITEKEVSLYREQNVCLVCKGELRRFSVYLCPKCKVLYCENCARTLENSENMCWVCSEPIDESKPVRPFKRDKEEIIIKSSEKKPEKQKTDKISSKK